MAHAKQFKRANRMLKKLRTYLDRVSFATSAARSRQRRAGGEVRKAAIAGAARPRAAAASARAMRGSRMHRQGKAHRRYEFGVKVALPPPSSTARRPVRHHVKALPGNPMTAHAGNRIRDGSAPPATPSAHPRRQGIFAATCAARPQVQGLPPGQKRGVTRRSNGTTPQGCCRTRHRPSQSRAPMGRNYLGSGRRCQ